MDGFGLWRHRSDRRDRAMLGATIESGARIRGHLDSEAVVGETVREIARKIRGCSASLWLTTGKGEPRLAAQTGDAVCDQPSRDVLRSISRRRSVRSRERGELVVPVVAPRSGLLGAVAVCRLDLAGPEERFVTALARECALALETANLYEQAVSAKEKSEALLAHVADAVVVTDPRGKILDWNPAAENLTGCPAKSALGQHCNQLLGMEMGERHLDCSQGCALLRERTDSHLGTEVWRRRASGRQPLLVNVSTVSDSEGHITEVVHSVRDVTRLKEADEAKTLFLATASHELKTPLTVIQGFAQTLRSAPQLAGEERAMALDAMSRRAVELNKIVERLMLSSRIEAGRTEVHLEDFDIGPVIIERSRHLAKAMNRSISVEIAPGLPAARCDPDAFITVFDHLLDNAVKYSPDGGPISIACGFGDATVRMAISDHGIGMDPEQAARCFEKFWQGESTDVRRFGGTGIGLYIVRSLVEAMGGTASVDSLPGVGSTFTLVFLRAGAVAEPAAVAAPLPEVATPEPSVIREFMRQIGIPTRSGT